MNNKKYFIDVSLEIDASNLSQNEEDVLIVTKQIGHQKIVLHLPVVEGGTAQGFKDDQIYDHYWNGGRDSKGRQGFWLREMTEKTKSGLELIFDEV
jgi:hypothetical protein